MKASQLVVVLSLLVVAASAQDSSPVRVNNRLHSTSPSAAATQRPPVRRTTATLSATTAPATQPPTLPAMRRVLDSNPGIHRLNERVLSDVFTGRDDEVVCTFCLLQVMSIVYQLGNGTVRQEIETALDSPRPAQLGETLLWAASAEKETLAGTLLGYYQRDQLQTCRERQEQLGASGTQLDADRCERIREFIADIGRRVDFHQPGTEEVINAQVERATGGRIKHLFPPLSPDTQLVFASALVFAAKWQSRLATRDGVFHGARGDITTEMLFTREELPILDGSRDGVVGVSLPYEQPGIRMFLFTTTDGSDVRQQLQQAHYERLAQIRIGTYTRLTFPSFHIQSMKSSYVDLATEMGMGTMFGGGLGVDDRLKVAMLQHKAVITTDRDGTEAAGAAGVAVVALSAKPQPFQAIFDRPFVCSLVHNDLAVPIFTTFVANPHPKGHSRQG